MQSALALQTAPTLQLAPTLQSALQPQEPTPLEPDLQPQATAPPALALQPEVLQVRFDPSIKVGLGDPKRATKDTKFRSSYKLVVEKVLQINLPLVI